MHNDLFGMFADKRIHNFRFANDGGKLACVVSQFKGYKIISHLWLYDKSTQKFDQLTFSDKNEKKPAWAPDATTLSFLSDPNGKMQVFTMANAAGEPVAMTDGDLDVSDFRWSLDGTQIVFLAKKKLQTAKTDAQVVDSVDDLPALFLLDVASHKQRQLSKGNLRTQQVFWTGRDKLMLFATDKLFVEAWTNKIYALDITTGDCKVVATPDRPFENSAISPDMKHFAFMGTALGGPNAHDLFVGDTGTGKAVDMTTALDRQVGNARWQGDSQLIVSAADGFYNRLFKIDLDKIAASADKLESIVCPLSVSAFDVATDGTLAYVGVDFAHLPELYIKRPGGVDKQISNLQADFKSITLSNAEIFKCKSFDGQTIEAALFKGANGDSPKKRPLILLVHGGPAGNFSADYFWFNSWAQLLVEHGYDVLMVNPRGSTGYGEKFLKANRYDWGGGDYKDLMAALETVIARGETDQGKLAIGGWSYGGEMSIWATTQSNRFKAAVVGGCVYDQAAEFETESSSTNDEWFLGTPWDNPEVFARCSPSAQIKNDKTPTLIVHGKDDRSNPVGQSQGLYRALKYLGTETQLVLYPNEGHLPQQKSHQIDILERMVDWYDRFLK